MNKPMIEFRQLRIPIEYGAPIYTIYYVVENNRSKVWDNFKPLPENTKEKIKNLICRIATVPNFRSDQIKHLRKYGFYELRPKPHRFFYFRKCGDNLIFFDYILKKTNKLDDDIYRQINRRKQRYDSEFEKFI